MDSPLPLFRISQFFKKRRRRPHEKRKKIRKMNINWYLIHAKARQEGTAEMNLQHLGVETFCPRFKQIKSNRCKTQAEGKGPLFPGYLFVRVDMSTEFRKVTYAHGVLRVVKFGSAPAVVEEGIIHSIRAREDNGLVVLSPSFFLKPGQAVLIDKGPFSGFEAIFEQELNGMNRVALLLKTVAYQGRIVIDRACLAI
jgi:transcription elongation factor/antiterminator RfaH